MSDHNYATLVTWPDHQPGWCMLEWDVALDRVGRRHFADNALADPDRVMVAPYWIYPGDRPPEQPHRNHGQPIRPSTETADTFGLGCIYLPDTVLDHFWRDPPVTYTDRDLITDTTFSDWYRHHYPPARVDWTTRPQHLHGD